MKRRKIRGIRRARTEYQGLTRGHDDGNGNIHPPYWQEKPKKPRYIPRDAEEYGDAEQPTPTDYQRQLTNRR